ncbi:phage integrase N-terminal domain-containing protein [Burkholderia metallica]|uniref:phage integrase N-terminal domain-containing protein n=1 Tax=Burkholderia metallica TaxID=488729 RepID=UPI0020C5E944|nr:phage integrase N-terminal domain-containing protein [Burkholderia metallica]
MSAGSLKSTHVNRLVERWQAEGLSACTLKNRMAHLRWWAERVSKAASSRPDNARLGIPERQHVTIADKSKTLGDALDGVRDTHVRTSLQLQQAFGLWREESIEFPPGYAGRGDHIVLKGSWTKGGASARCR